MGDSSVARPKRCAPPLRCAQRRFGVLLPLTGIAILFLAVTGLPKFVWAFLDLVAAVAFFFIGLHIAGAPNGPTPDSDASTR